MEVLIACDIDSYLPKNPYVTELMKGLNCNDRINTVKHGTFWMKVKKADLDVIHIQWPEALVGWRKPNKKRLKETREALENCKDSTIVATVHNSNPHYNENENFDRLYRMVYSYADGIIHMGKESKRVMRKKYNEEMKKSVEKIIPHGNYSLFERNTSKKNAREKIGLEISENVFLCFGKLRDKEELDFLRSGFSRSSVPRKRLVIAGRLPARSRKSPKHYVFRIPLWLDSKISIYERFIPPANVNYYVRSSDVVIIPRLHALNSGNVALGLTFGKIVVGTETGVIGEMLQNLGNPTFDPSAPDTLSNALERAADMIGGPITKKNRSYARENLDWSRIAEKHYQFYRQVRK